MSKFAAKIALITALLVAPGALPAFSQTAPGGGTTTTTPGDTTTQVDDDNDNGGENGYWGLLGLLGLFGLLGRKSRRDETTTTAYRDPDAVSSTPRDRY
ncbi:MAG: hypothetical protein KME13_23020 [Myxacorys californica WJT36-NPBG1]|jgi:hypothetical protein|nr:hypothetical protein [Myxacorys californica WJT36-NPBG1]